MFSKSQAKAFFLVGTALCSTAFVLLTIDTLKRIPAQTNAQNLTPEVIQGKHLFESNNCAGCHTLMGEGAYYAPELTKVYLRRGETFITAMLRDPESMYPGQRKMVKYNFTDPEIKSMVAFLKWIGEMDLNGFPAKPTFMPPEKKENIIIGDIQKHPQVFSQMCTACHALGGQGGNVGPALDGVGSRRDQTFLNEWLRDPLKVKSDSKMPKLPLSEEQISELTHFLSQLKETN